MKHDSISKLITYRDIIHRSTSDRHFKKVVPQKKPFFKKRFDNRILAKGESNDITDSDEEYDDEGNEECDEEDDEEDADSCENDSSTTSAAKSNQKTNTLNDNAATVTFQSTRPESGSRSTLDNEDDATTKTKTHHPTATRQSTSTDTSPSSSTHRSKLSNETTSTHTSAATVEGGAEEATTGKGSTTSEQSTSTVEKFPTSSEQPSTTTKDIVTISTSLLPTFYSSNITSMTLASTTSDSVYSSTRLFTSDTLTSSSAAASISSIAVATNIPVSQKDNTAAIAGGALGGVVGLAIVIAVSLLLFKRARYNKNEKSMQEQMSVPGNTKNQKTGKKKEIIQVDESRSTAAAANSVRAFVPPVIGSNVPPYNEEITLHPYAQPYSDESYYYPPASTGAGYFPQIGDEYYGYQSPNHNEYYGYPDIGETNYVDNGYYNYDGNINLVGTESNSYNENNYDVHHYVNKPKTKG